MRQIRMVVRTTVAERLRAEIRAGDTEGRLGGDEFVVVLESVTTEDLAVDVGDRILGALSQPIEVAEGQLARVGASVGITFNLDGSLDAEAVLHEADIALYRAKNSGRDQVLVFSPLRTGDPPGQEPDKASSKAKQLRAAESDQAIPDDACRGVAPHTRHDARIPPCQDAVTCMEAAALRGLAGP